MGDVPSLLRYAIAYVKPNRTAKSTVKNGVYDVIQRHPDITLTLQY